MYQLQIGMHNVMSDYACHVCVLLKGYGSHQPSIKQNILLEIREFAE